MKTKIRLAFFLCTMAIGSAVQGQPPQVFEGKVTYICTTIRAETDTSQRIMVLYIKKNKVRMDFLADAQAFSPHISRISNADTKLSTLISYQTQLAGVSSTAKPLQGTLGVRIIPDSTTTTNILGYNCIKINTQTPDANTVNWVANINFDYNRLLGVFNGASAGLLPPNTKGLPLQTIINNTQNNLTTQIIATKIETQTIDDAIFEIPAGMQIMNLDKPLDPKIQNEK